MRKFHMYVASCVPDGGIYHYVYENGRLHEISKTPADRPMYLALQGDRLYAVLREPFADDTNSGVCWWHIDADGDLYGQSEIFSTGGRCGCHLTVENDHVYVANYLSGSLCMLPEGKLVTHAGSGVHPTRQEAPHVHFVGSTPDKKWLLAVDLGLDTIYMYTPDLETAKPVCVPAGHGCRHLAWSEDGKYCFCVNELASTLSVFRYDRDTLILTDTIPLLAGEPSEQNTAAAIRVVGERIYVSVRGCDQILTLTHQEGVLTEPVGVAAEGKSPRDIHVIGELLFSANESSDCVTVFCIKDGALHLLDTKIAVPKPLCIVFGEN